MKFSNKKNSKNGHLTWRNFRIKKFKIGTNNSGFSDFWSTDSQATGVVPLDSWDSGGGRIWSQNWNISTFDDFRKYLDLVKFSIFLLLIYALSGYGSTTIRFVRLRRGPNLKSDLNFHHFYIICIFLISIWPRTLTAPKVRLKFQIFPKISRFWQKISSFSEK